MFGGSRGGKTLTLCLLVCDQGYPMLRALRDDSMLPRNSHNSLLESQTSCFTPFGSERIARKFVSKLDVSFCFTQFELKVATKRFRPTLNCEFCILSTHRLHSSLVRLSS